jgi:hypothetical protein
LPTYEVLNEPWHVPVLGLRHLLAVQGLADERIAAIAAIAARQRGRVSRPQLLAAGLSDRMIRTRVDGRAEAAAAFVKTLLSNRAASS